MGYLCVNKDGTEMCFTGIKPERWRNEWVLSEDDIDSKSYELESGTIFKTIGRELTWCDEPYKLE